MVEIVVVGNHDVGEARRKIVDFCTTLPFINEELEEVAIVVTELATNIVRHTDSGGVISCELKQGGRPGVIIRAVDYGPGIKDLWEAIADGKSTRGSLGGGLGAVTRLSTQISIESGTQGTSIEVFKMPKTGSQSNLKMGVYARPHPEHSVSGDGYYVRSEGGRTLTVLFDVLGHGAEAHKVAHQIERIIRNSHSFPLPMMVYLIHHQLKGGRGAVLSAALIDEELGICEFAGIGNVEALVIRQNSIQRLVNQNGVLGIRMPEIQVRRLDWEPGSLLVMTSDGVAKPGEPDENWAIEGGDPGSLCRQIVEKWGRLTDDASVLIAWDKR